MYARVARFEGIDPGKVDAQIATMKQQLAAASGGELPEGAPEEVRTLMETVARYVQLVDRDNGRAVGISFCTSEEDMRRANEALNAMSPDVGEGRRVGSAELYEVAIDESFA